MSAAQSAWLQPETLATVSVLAVLAVVTALRLGVGRCARRSHGHSADEDSFFSCNSSLPLLDAEESEAEWTAIAEEQGWTPAERLAAAHFDRSLPEDVPKPEVQRLLQVLWSRSLEVEASLSLWLRHLDAIRRLGVAAIDDTEVREAYAQGFCVCAGSDWDGRPICWVRLARTIPAQIRAATCVRNTWLAQDFLLGDGGVAASRVGLCFVYDAFGVGLQNITIDPRWIRASLWGGPSHPSHISRVVILDAPGIFVAAWNAFKHLLPGYLRDVVCFEATQRSGWGATCAEEQLVGDAALARICPPESLPVYLGGDERRFGEAFVDRMFRGLAGQGLPYRGGTQVSNTTPDQNFSLPPEEEAKSFGMAGNWVLSVLNLERSKSRGR